MRAILTSLLLTAAAHSQSITGSITGTIKDPGGLAVSAAQVKLIHAATGTQREVSSNELGDFQFLSVVPGDYRLMVSASGFKTAERVKCGSPHRTA